MLINQIVFYNTWIHYNWIPFILTLQTPSINIGDSTNTVQNYEIDFNKAPQYFKEAVNKLCPINTRSKSLSICFMTIVFQRRSEIRTKLSPSQKKDAKDAFAIPLNLYIVFFLSTIYHTWNSMTWQSILVYPNKIS